MKFLVVHNTYTEVTGEDMIIQTFNGALRRLPDFDVVEYTRHSRPFHHFPLRGKIRDLIKGNLPFFVPRDFRELLDREQPDIALIHNTIPLINPWILPELRRRRIPVLATIYNFRLLCPRGTCVLNENFCDLCHRWTPIWSMIFNCLRKRSYSLIYAYRFCIHHLLLKYIDAFICSVKYRTEFMQGHLPKHKVYFLIHYMSVDPQLIESSEERQDYILFAGRFVEDKGIRLALECAKSLPKIQFKIYGEGPLEGMCRDFISSNRLTNVELHPWAKRQDNLKHIRFARIFLFPSVYREFGGILCEAMLLKTACVVARNPVSQTVIRPGENGFLFDPKNIPALVDTIKQIWNDTALLKRVGEQAHKEVLRYNDIDFFVQQVQDIARDIKREGSKTLRD